MDNVSLDRPGSWQRYDQHAADVTASQIGQYDMKGIEAGLTILVVEDEWLLRQALCEELREAGWKVVEAASGERALAILRSDQAIALLITDIRLDGAMTGWELARICREAHARLPVIYVSANPLEEAKRVQGSVFLSKPCMMERLLAMCRALTE